MKPLLLILISLSILSACKSQSDTETNVVNNDTLIYVSTIDSLNVPESVCQSPDKNMFYVANINGMPTDVDSNGFITIVNNEGVVNKWIEGLNAPKGMAYFKNWLCVTDINRIVVIDIAQGKIMATYPIDSAQFLNDVTVDDNGIFYVSDSYGNKVYSFDIQNKPEVFIDKDLDGANGMFYSEDKLYIGNKNYILEYDLKNAESKKIEVNKGGIDGLYKMKTGDFLISDWKGNVHIVKANGDVKLLLSTEAQEINAADFCFVEDTKTLFIPTFFANSVMIYKLESRL